MKEEMKYTTIGLGNLQIRISKSTKNKKWTRSNYINLHVLCVWFVKGERK